MIGSDELPDSQLLQALSVNVSDEEMDELAKLWSAVEYEDAWGKRELVIHTDDYHDDSRVEHLR